MQYDETKRMVMFYHYSSRMKYYHGHTGVLYFDVSMLKAEEIFCHTLMLDKMINSNQFQELVSTLEGEKTLVKKLATVTAVTIIKSKTTKAGKISYNFDTVFYDNDETWIENRDEMLLSN